TGNLFPTKVAINNSTIASNTAPAGGGIVVDDGTLQLTCSTIANNTATGGPGGGLWVLKSASLNFCTVAGNQSATGQGGGFFNGSNLSIANTIVAGNSAFQGPDGMGPVASQGFNLIGNAAGISGLAASDLQGVNPKLGSQQDNGGPTLTM